MSDPGHRERRAVPPEVPATVVEPRASGATRTTGPGVARELRRGTTLGRYVLLEPIGQGGMGEVWSAYDPELDRKVALKLLRPDRDLLLGRGARERLQREAQALARLSHPNVLTVFDVGTIGERVFIATELLAGTNLRVWWEAAPRSWREVRAQFLLAGRGLAAAHRAGLVHRDFKPENVLVGEGGEVKVLDFGLARRGAEERELADAETVELPPVPAQRLLDTPLTQAGAVSGTLPYMAPEQVLGGRADARSDQFSFCVALFEALHGTRPFHGANPPALVQAIVAGEVVEPPAGKGVPRFLRQALRRGMARHAEDRFASMDELLAALSRDPLRTWSRGVAAAGALVLLAAGAIAGVVAMRQRAQLCRGAERHLAGVWDDGRREATRQAFAATKLPFADEAWRLAAAGLDRYAKGWTAMRRDACEATQLRGEQSAQLLDLRMSCLDEGLAQVRALGQAFAAPDKPVVQNAAAAVEGLPPVADCADLRALTGLRPPPPQARTRVAALRGELAQAQAHYDLGHYADSLRIADRVVPQATALGYKPLLAEALLRRGKAQSRGDAPAVAVGPLSEAAWAGEASRHDEVVAAAATDLVELVGYRLEDRKAAEPWARLAQAVIERNGSPPRWKAELADDLGLAAMVAGDHQVAIAQMRASLAFVEKSRLSPLERADTLQALGGVLFYAGRGSESVPYLREALEIRRRHQGELHPLTARAANNLGAAALGVGDYATGVELVKQALDIKRRLLGPDNPELGTSINNLAEALRLAERYDEAEPRYHEAMALWRRAYGEEHPYLAEGYDGLGALENDRGRPEAALVQHRRAHEIREKKHGANHPRLAYSLTGEGKALVALGRAGEALPLLERALRLRSKDADPVELAETRFALAKALRALGRDRTRARTLAEQAAVAYTEAGPRGVRQRTEIAAWLQKQGWSDAAAATPQPHR